MRIGICAIIKNENLYLREWVEYHKKLGFDKIMLYDNNPSGGEYPQQVIGDYVMDGFVDVYNARDLPWNFESDGVVLDLQTCVYNLCRVRNSKEIQWMAFIDIDEFIVIEETEPQDIHVLFNKYKYDESPFDQIIMPWFIIGSDQQIHYENKPVRERFQRHANSESRAESMSDHWVKSIVRTSIPQKWMFPPDNPHAIPIINTCFGDLTKNENPVFRHWVKNPVHKVLYVNHYCTKSLWEHLVRRITIHGDAEAAKDQYLRLADFKGINGWCDKYEKTFKYFHKYVNSEKLKKVNIDDEETH